ncbi:MAG: putative DNA modification/repair radical SAM protein [Elusimicrobia bacterium]|nr:putative DNA modification/repair radical SAM protein [Elusimicrobiota bacterium]MBD3412026.1 putative DNA modification/repair radical SAM protein [Elusimicrobiota bacterium]
MQIKIHTAHTPEQKLDLLGQAAQYDLSCACGESAHRKRDYSRWIYPAVLPSGGHIAMLKILLSNECKNDCTYCANRASASVERVSFTPAELSAAFMHCFQSKMVNALFLTSAVVKSSDYTMSRMIQTVEMLRYHYRFRGFIHLKILPGTSYSLIERAVQIATRVSVNLECPTARSLKRIAPDKEFTSDLLQPIADIRGIIARCAPGKKDQTTQFVVGASDETDQEILDAVWKLYRGYKLSRSYFSAYQPAAQFTHAITPTPIVREHRLYQADFLMRRYGFDFREFSFCDNGNLPLDKDPKQRWADMHQEFFPVELMESDYSRLIRVPGIGPLTAKKLISARKDRVLRDENDLDKLGIPIHKAGLYMTFKGKKIRTISPRPNQLALEL